MNATIILAHGSRRAETNETMDKLIEMVLEKVDDEKVVPAYLQLAKPMLLEVVEQLKSEGVKLIKVIPMFIFDGVHVTTDIPDEIDSLRVKYPDIKFELKSNIGADRGLADILVSKIRENN